MTNKGEKLDVLDHRISAGKEGFLKFGIERRFRIETLLDSYGNRSNTGASSIAMQPVQSVQG
jgi:hypothetical protein